MKNLTTLLLCLLVAGCVSTPPAETVATTCTRAQKEVQVDVRGNSRLYRETVQGKCVDDASHQTIAKDELEQRRGQVTTKTAYDAKDGDKRTQVATEKSVGPGFRSEVTVVKENKFFVWGVRSKIQTR
jgi:hypothetical protein